MNSPSLLSPKTEGKETEKMQHHKIKIEGAIIDVYVHDPEYGVTPAAHISAEISIDPLADEQELAYEFRCEELPPIPGIETTRIRDERGHSRHMMWRDLHRSRRFQMLLTEACPSRSTVIATAEGIVNHIRMLRAERRAFREAALRARELTLHDAGW